MDLTFVNKINEEVLKHFPLIAPISAITFDGAVNRYDSTKLGDKAVWVCVHEWDYKGNTYQKAIFGNWRNGNQHTVTSYKDGEQKDEKFRAKEKRKYEETKERLEQEKQEKHKKCREKWEPHYHNLIANATTHEYLLAKGIDSNYHARIDHLNNVLFIPAWNSKREFVGGQRIFKNPENNQYEKRYTFGIEKLGSFCPFGDIANAKFIYIAEGYATAASIFMAFKSDPNIAVISVWDTSNLLEGAKAIREINKECYITFAADNDIHNDPKWNDIGYRKAKQAAFKLSNAIVKKVKFEYKDATLSDYNDLHVSEGLAKVKDQLTISASEFHEIIPLGFEAKEFYYFSTRRKKIFSLTKNQHTSSNLILEAPRKYWGERYGFIKNKDNQDTTKPDWNKILEKLGEEISAKGVFKLDKIRGLGAWEEKGEILVNLGNKIYFKDRMLPFFNNGVKSKFFYEAMNRVDVNFKKELTKDEKLKFVQAYSKLRYKNESDFILLLGWVYCAQVFSALPWRPHIWISAERGSGKSTILNYIKSSILFSIIVQDSTAAGLRQDLMNNAMAVIYDESEPNNDKDRKKISEVLSLARQCSTKIEYKVLRGSATGTSLSFNTNSIFCLGSIQKSQTNAADISRFFNIELKNLKDQKKKDFQEIQKIFNEIKDLAPNLFVSAVNNYKRLISNITIAKEFIMSHGVEARQADQLAPVVAGYHAFLYEDEITANFINEVMEMLDFKKSDYAESNDESDSDNCLHDLLAIQIPGKPINIGQTIEKYKEENGLYFHKEYDSDLALIGLRFLKDKNQLFISLKSSVLKNKLEQMSSYSDYISLLKRHESFTRNGTMRINGKVGRGIFIDTDLI